MRFKPKHPPGVEDCNCTTTPHFLNSARVAGKGNTLARLRTIRKSETQKVECSDPADHPACQGEPGLRNGLSAHVLGSRLIRSFRLMSIVLAAPKNYYSEATLTLVGIHPTVISELSPKVLKKLE
jgi:hypothetical protein